jgi:serine/threonine protein phosphatase PrpC
MTTYIYQQHPDTALAEWLVAKGSESSPISAIQYHLCGRIALLGRFLVASIDAVGRATLANLANLHSAQQSKPFYQNQMRKATHSLSTALSCLRSVISPQSLQHRLEGLPPTFKECTGPVPLKLRPFRIKRGQTTIARKMDYQYKRAQTQALNEPDKAFKYLSAPSHFRDFSDTERVSGHEVGVCHCIGRRPTMEDAHLATSFSLNIRGKTYPVQLFGIFDGHGGSRAAEFVRTHLKLELQRTLREFATEGLSDPAIWNALKITCAKLHAKFRGSEGTTAAIAMILDGKLWTANVGDSRAILDNGVQLTEDAKPNDPYYKKGIEKLGGYVTSMFGWPHSVPRINGNLAVARAIGDHGITGVIERPKIIGRPLSEFPKGSHLILACDGIFDVASTRQVAAAVRARRTESAQDLAMNIVYSAYEAMSRDNLSALVVKL